MWVTIGRAVMAWRAKRASPGTKQVVAAIAVIGSLLGVVSPSTAADEGAPLFTKEFSPAIIGPNSTTTLVLTIDNSASVFPAQQLAFTDSLPVGVSIAAGNPSTTCTEGVVSAPDGGSTITFSDGELPAGGTCTVSVDVTAGAVNSSDNTYSNAAGPLTSSLGSSDVAIADLMVDIDLPGFTKSFAPAAVDFGERSTLTFNIDNSLNAADVASLSFTDNLPAGMLIADPANANTDCGHPLSPATLTAAPGADVVSLSAFGSVPFAPSLEAGASCSLQVDVVAVAGGLLLNSSGPLADADNTDIGKANAKIDVNVADLHISKDFVNDPVSPGAAATLVFTIHNFDRDDFATGVGFIDMLPVGVVIAPSPNVSFDCGGAVTANAGDATIELASGSVSSGQSCSVSVDVAAANPGTYMNTTDAVTGTVAGIAVTGNSATESLYVVPAPILTKTFTDDPVAAGGQVTLEFTITDTTLAGGSTDIEFLDELTGGSGDGGASTGFLPFPVSVLVPLDPCGAGSSLSLAAISDERQGLLLVGGSLAQGASCTFEVLLNIPVDMAGGTYTNTTGPISATVGGATVVGAPASDDVVIVGGVSLSKEFGDTTIAPGDSTTLEFTLSHADTAPTDASGVLFTDDLTTMGTGITFTTLPTNPCGPIDFVATSAGDTLLEVSNVTLAPGETCTFTVGVQTSVTTPVGTLTNTTSKTNAVVAGLVVEGPAATADLQTTPLTLTKQFGDPVLPGDTVVLSFTLANADQATSATGIAFTDSLSSVLAGLVATTLPIEPCGVGSSLSGTSLLIFTGGSLDPGASCTFMVELAVPLVPAVAGQYSNITSLVISSFGTSPPARDVLDVELPLPPSLTKHFAPDAVVPGESVNLEFTLNNPNDIQILEAIAFNDDLAAGLPGVVATAVSNTCSGMANPALPGDVFNYSGATLLPGESCQIVLSLAIPASAIEGPFENVTTAPTAVATVAAGTIPLSGAPASDTLTILPADSVPIEVGKVKASFAAITVSFMRTFTDPVVVVGPPESADATPVTVLVENLTPTSFDVRLKTYPNQPGGPATHAPEFVSYLVVERGSHVLPSGNRVVADSVSLNDDASPGLQFQPVSFGGTPFLTTPAVMATVASENAADTAIVRLANVGLTGFDGSLSEAEAPLTPGHVDETVNYVAWDFGDVNDRDPIAWHIQEGFANHNGATVSNSGTKPCVLSQIQTFRGNQPASSRHLSVTDSSVGFKVEEEQSRDAEIAHLKETFAIFAFPCDRAPMPIEVGKVSVSEAGTIVSLSETFTDPIVVVGPPESSDAAPVTVLVDNVTPTSFDIRLKTYPNQPGGPTPHAAEQVSYLVVERGSHVLPSGAKVVAGSAQLTDPGYRSPVVSGAPLPGSQFQAVNFGSSFATAPVVMATVASENNAETVVVRLRDIGLTGFNAKLREVENPLTFGHIAETVNYVAWDLGEDNSNDPLQWQVQQAVANHNPTTVAVNGPKPCVLSQIQTYRGVHTVSSRHINVTDVSVILKAEEEQSFDVEVFHIRETFGVLAFACGALGGGGG
jgi:hypothetical protein